jgi:hypothetical protein
MLHEKALSGDIRAMQLYLKAQGGWTEKTHVELSRAEEPVDRHWAVEVMGLLLIQSANKCVNTYQNLRPYNTQLGYRVTNRSQHNLFFLRRRFRQRQAH